MSAVISAVGFERGMSLAVGVVVHAVVLWAGCWVAFHPLLPEMGCGAKAAHAVASKSQVQPVTLANSSGTAITPQDSLAKRWVGSRDRLAITAAVPGENADLPLEQ